jgi:predicted ATPase
MLKRILVDGFRSLLDFQVTMQPGLNVIVGANGSGKSNFITFLDFLAAMIESDLNSAIAVAQGAGAVFSKERFVTDKAAELKFTLEGELRPFDPDTYFVYLRNEEEARSLSGVYLYECVVSYSSEIPAVFISSETLTVAVKSGGPLTITRNTHHTAQGFKTRVDISPKRNATGRRLFAWTIREDPKISPSEFLESRLSPERSILIFLAGEAPAFTYIMNDLMRYRSVNVDPSMARKSTPVGSLLTLMANGEGLSGALYQLKKKAYTPGRRTSRFMPRRTAITDVFPSIISWCKEVNPAIEDVDVRLDHMDAQLRPYMYLRHGDRLEEYSFSRISDGTVKWLALTTILFAEPGLSLIEEPENFLHPFMQESFVALCRQAIERDQERTIIISTHSPTLLDCCSPGELTIFEAVEGETRASRVANREQLAEKVENSRFGVGYYYKIGALYGDNSGNR